MNDWSRRRQAVERHRPDNDGKQHQKRDLLNGPKRWDVVRVKQVLRERFQEILAEIVTQQGENEVGVKPTS